MSEVMSGPIAGNAACAHAVRPMPRVRPFLMGWCVFSALALATLAIYATWRGQDFNWDQLNYHLGIPWLLANSTFWDSVAPAGIQSYLCPYVLQAQFWVLRHFGAVTAALILATAQSAAFLTAGAICSAIAFRRGAGAWTALLGSLLCLLSPMALAEAGTTFIDLVMAFPVLAAYGLLLTRGMLLGGVASGALAGALLGAVAALKLTNGIFALGVAGFALAGTDAWRERARWFAACAAVAAIAFVAVGGSWYLDVWRHFGNPFFPFYNNIFHSPDAVHAGDGAMIGGGYDYRFLPHSPLAIWRYPLYWLTGGSPTPGLGSPSSEVPLRDARWIVAVGGLTLGGVALAAFRDWRARRLAEPETGLLLAFAIAYLVWLFQFDIHRYAIALELLCGAVLLVLFLAIRPAAARLGAMTALVVAACLLMVVPDWGHIPWRASWQPKGQLHVRLADRAIVFVGGQPSLLVATGLPRDTRYVGVTDQLDLRAGTDTRLTRQLKADLAETPAAPLLELDRGVVEPVMAATLASYGLEATDRCERLLAGPHEFRLCDVRRR